MTDADNLSINIEKTFNDDPFTSAGDYRLKGGENRITETQQIFVLPTSEN